MFDARILAIDRNNAVAVRLGMDETVVLRIAERYDASSAFLFLWLSDFGETMKYLCLLAVLTAPLLFADRVCAQATTAELAIGAAAPDFQLKTIGDKPVVLSERFGEKGKPVVLIFSRANW